MGTRCHIRVTNLGDKLGRRSALPGPKSLQSAKVGPSRKQPHQGGPSTYAPKVIVTSSYGVYVRAVPAALADSLVSEGTAVPAPCTGRGRIREVQLVRAAATSAERIGPPTPAALGNVRFTRWIQLDSTATRVLEHHPRCTYQLLPWPKRNP